MRKEALGWSDLDYVYVGPKQINFPLMVELMLMMMTVVMMMTVMVMMMVLYIKKKIKHLLNKEWKMCTAKTCMKKQLISNKAISLAKLWTLVKSSLLIKEPIQTQLEN